MCVSARVCVCGGVGRVCKSHYEEERSSLPHTYCWLLDLLSFLLGVPGALLHEEVLRVERHMFGPQRSKSWRAGNLEERTRRKKGRTGKSGKATPGRDRRKSKKWAGGKMKMKRKMKKRKETA